MIRSLLKSGLFVLSVHALSVADMLLLRDHLVSDTVWIGCLIALCILTIPMYFLVKKDTPRKWIYLLCSISSHIICTLLVSLVLGIIFEGWDNSIIYWTEIFLSFAFGITAVVDCVVNFRS